MSDWLHALPVGWMAVVVFGATYVATGGIYALVIVLATGERARAFKAVTPGLLPPLGIIFGLFVAFLAAQVWNDLDRAGAPETRLRGLIHTQIEAARDVEWAAMSHRRATIVMIPKPLAEAIRRAMSLSPTGDGQVAAQREILAALENALDARRQRILVSQAAVNGVKWAALIVQAAVTLLAIAMVHCDNRLSAGLALGLFSTAVGVCVLLLVAHDRPFIGQLAVGPAALLQVMPDGP